MRIISDFQFPIFNSAQSSEYVEQKQLNRAQIIRNSTQSRDTRLCSCFSTICWQRENPQGPELESMQGFILNIGIEITIRSVMVLLWQCLANDGSCRQVSSQTRKL